MKVEGAAKFDMNYSLPIIKIPENKVITFWEWFEKDIYTSKYILRELPQVFKEGYMFIEEIPYYVPEDELNIYIKSLAKKSGRTFREIQNGTFSIYKLFTENIIVHFKFDEKIGISTYFYSTVSNSLIGETILKREVIDTDEIDFETPFHIDKKKLCITGDIHTDTINGYNFQADISTWYIKLLVCSMWYMELYKNKYKYEKGLIKDDVKEVILKKKRTTHHNNTQVITTSLYDLGKTPKSKVETLIKKRAGFEYSHQFNVKGHYRHYQDGKIVFIESYVKAKDKPVKQKQILLNPKN